MGYRYSIYNKSNDLLLSATQKQAKIFRRRFLIGALSIAGIIAWWASHPHSTAPASAVLASTATPAASSTPLEAAIASSLAAGTPMMLATDNTVRLDTTPAAPVKPTVTASLNSKPAANGAPQWQTVTLKKGDTLGKVFSKTGLSAKQLQQVMAIKEVKTSLKRLQPGNQIKLLVSADKQLQQLSFALNTIDTLEIARTKDALNAKIIHAKADTQLTYAGAVVSRNFSQAMRKAGLQSKLTAQLAAIFKDKVDITKVRAGDRFKVLFEEEYIKGKKVRTGSIVAAEVNLQGKTYRAVRYVDAKGKTEFYTPEGKSLKKGFDRYPLTYTYISSGFSHNRFDPVAHRIASHPAIDFAAPQGTPIHAASDGKIVTASYNGGYGNMVLIKHDHKYESLYAHMQRFAANIRPGSYVKQGQVIGYVGQTGMATGPHLHYEVHVNGAKRNPLTIDLPSAAPLNRLARAKFIPQARQLMAQLQNNSKVRLVNNEHDDTNG